MPIISTRIYQKKRAQTIKYTCRRDIELQSPNWDQNPLWSRQYWLLGPGDQAIPHLVHLDIRPWGRSCQIRMLWIEWRAPGAGSRWDLCWDMDAPERQTHIYECFYTIGEDCLLWSKSTWRCSKMNANVVRSDPTIWGANPSKATCRAIKSLCQPTVKPQNVVFLRVLLCWRHKFWNNLKRWRNWPE